MAQKPPVEADTPEAADAPDEPDAPEVADRRRQQADLYGAPVDELATLIEAQTGLPPGGLARTIGISLPMLTEVRAGRRARIGNPLASSRLALLRDLAADLASGRADRADVELTLAQIRASTLAPGPGLTTPAARRTGGDAGSGLHPVVPGSGSPGHGGLLTRESLEAARELVGRHLASTPTRRWPLLEELTGTETWVKHENHLPTGSFKVRGGLRYVSQLLAREPSTPGLVAATRGNHGQSLAYAAGAFGLSLTIVVPEGNSPDKNAAMRALGADLVVHGSDFQEAVEHARRLAAERGLTLVPSYHRWLVEGVATYVAELHESVRDLDVVYVPLGMGSGVCANIAVRDLLGLRTEVVGVVAEQAPAYALSYEARRVVTTPAAHTFVDGVACRTPDADAVSTVVRGAARVVRVSERQAAEAMAHMYTATHNLAEPAGSLALAGLLLERDRVAGQRVAVVHTGGNCDFAVLDRAMSARGAAS